MNGKCSGSIWGGAGMWQGEGEGEEEGEGGADSLFLVIVHCVL